MPKALQAQDATLNRYVDIQYNGTDFKAVLRQFTQQTGYNFAYNNQLLPVQKNIDVQYQNIKADKALRDFLHQHGLDYQPSGTTLILKKWSPTSTPKQHFLSGRVIQDHTGERLVKAIVQIPEIQLFRHTDEFGIFKIALPEKQQPSSDTLHLQIYYPGYD
ncbi:MAG: STN domain-containing protein, partial [Bacteroidota bacterium]